MKLKKIDLKAHKEFLLNPLTIIFAASSLFFFSQLIGMILALPFTELVTNKNYEFLFYIAGNTLALYGLLSIARQVFGFSWKAIGLRFPRAKAYVWIIPSFFAYFLITITLMLLVKQFIQGFDAEQAQDVGFKGSQQWPELLAAFVGLVVLTPLFEETLLRGVLFRGLRQKLPFTVSALITSLLFGLAHMQWNVGVDTFALGLVLCFLVEKTDSIVPAILLHALKNSIAFLYLFIVK